MAKNIDYNTGFIIVQPIRVFLLINYVIYFSIKRIYLSEISEILLFSCNRISNFF